MGKQWLWPTMGAVIVLVILGGGRSAYALEPVAVILEQPDAPLQIKEYACYYDDEGYSKRIGHRPEYRNTTERIIVAIGMGFVMFDVWDDHMRSSIGVLIEDLHPGQEENETWLSRPYGASSFHTGVTFVSRVRFENGDVWKADEDDIAEQIRVLFKSFKPEQLKEDETE